MNKSYLLFVCCLTISACDHKSPTEIAKSTLNLCGPKVPFESIVLQSMEIISVEEKPAAGRDAWNVMFRGQHKLFLSNGEITVQVRKGKAVDFDGHFDALYGDLVVSITDDAKDAFCANEITRVLAQEIQPHLLELLTGAAVLKLAMLEHHEMNGDFPESKSELEHADGIGSIATKRGLIGSDYSIAPNDDILIDLPPYFRLTTSPQLTLSPVAEGPGFKWVCRSNLKEQEMDAIPSSCRVP